MWKARLALLIAPALLLTGSIAGAQNNGSFYNGVRDGGRGGQYNQDPRNYNQDRQRYDQQRYDRNNGYRNRDDNNGYRNGDYNNHQGGIGPGKGALIGGGGGALLGGLLGGGLKGALIGGGAGAGIGALVGKAHQNSVRRRDDSYYGR